MKLGHIGAETGTTHLVDAGSIASVVLLARIASLLVGIWFALLDSRSTGSSLGFGVVAFVFIVVLATTVDLPWRYKVGGRRALAFLTGAVLITVLIGSQNLNIALSAPTLPMWANIAVSAISTLAYLLAGVLVAVNGFRSIRESNRGFWGFGRVLLGSSVLAIALFVLLAGIWNGGQAWLAGWLFALDWPIVVLLLVWWLASSSYTRRPKSVSDTATGLQSTVEDMGPRR
ncbi:MAG: hypothetical protein WBI63_06670 [Coriobacteriia bacterium]